MKIQNHWLLAEGPSEKVTIKKSSNARDLIDPDYLIIHYTATDTASEAINWFMAVPPSNPDRIAAHIVIDTDGSITQLIPFNNRANHSGSSTWDDVDQMNYHSIGIELVNPGHVEKLANGSFRREKVAGVFKTYPADTAGIQKIKHKHRFWGASYWFSYPDAQLQALYKVSSSLIDKYQLIEAVGHDDVSPARKSDPGPAFSWDKFREQATKVFTHTGKIFTVNTEGTNFRSLPGTTTPVIKKLPKGYEVGLIKTNGQWSKVYLVNQLNDVRVIQNKKIRSIKILGWIHSSLLTVKA